MASQSQPGCAPKSATSDAEPSAADWHDGWLQLDPDNLPDSKLGPYLTTNNIKARNNYGRPDNVRLVRMFHRDDEAAWGPVTAFDASSDQRLWSVTHYRPVFVAKAEGRS
jgi:hypothetical protein